MPALASLSAASFPGMSGWAFIQTACMGTLSVCVSYRARLVNLKLRGLKSVKFFIAEVLLIHTVIEVMVSCV